MPENYLFNADRNLAIVRLAKHGIFPQFFIFNLNTFQTQKRINDASRSTAQAAFYLSEIRKFPIILTSQAEQQEIIRRIESLFKLAETIANQKSQIQNNLETLNQSILAKAFRGELVPQDPNDEPASVLLERIRQEKAKTQSTKSKTKTQKINNSSATQLKLPGIN